MICILTFPIAMFSQFAAWQGFEGFSWAAVNLHGISYHGNAH